VFNRKGLNCVLCVWVSVCAKRREIECLYVCEYVGVRKRERECVCVWERVSGYVSVWERKSVSESVWKREIESACNSPVVYHSNFIFWRSRRLRLLSLLRPFLSILRHFGCDRMSRHLGKSWRARQNLESFHQLRRFDVARRNVVWKNVTL